MLCLDLEGVLIPEVWVGVADRTGIDDLRVTTQEIPDYRELMQHRLAIIARHDLTLSLVEDVIAGLGGPETETIAAFYDRCLAHNRPVARQSK